MADLAMGAAACISFWRSLDFKAAVVIINAIFLLGDAIGHVGQMIAAGNFAPGNACVPLFRRPRLPCARAHSPDHRSAVRVGAANLLRVLQNTITLRTAAPEREEASASLMDSSR